MNETQPPEVTDEQIYEHLKQYQEAGMIDYVLPTEPLGEQWIVGWNGQILKFLAKEGIVGFLTGIAVCAQFAGKLKAAESAPVWEHPSWGAQARQAEAEKPSIVKGKAVRIIPERGPERNMIVSHVEHHAVTLTDPAEEAAR